MVLLGYSNVFNGAFAEQMILQKVPPSGAGSRAHRRGRPGRAARSCRPCGCSLDSRRIARSSSTAAARSGCLSSRARYLGLGPILAVDPDAARRRFAKHSEPTWSLPRPRSNVGAWWDKQGAPLGVSDAAPRVRRASRADDPLYSNASGNPGSSKASPKRRPRVLHGRCRIVHEPPTSSSRRT